MRGLAPALLVLSVACSGGVTTSTTTTDSQEGPVTTASACAAGFAEYLVKIEPIVVDFDPTTMSLREFYEVQDAADEVLDPDLTAPFNCEDEGLNWTYFSWQSAWDQILSIAREHAPGTIPFMEAFRQLSSLDEPAMEVVRLPSCQEAVIELEQAIDDQVAAGNEAWLDVPLERAVEILILSVASEAEGATCIPDGLQAKLDAFFPSRPTDFTTTSAP